MSEDMFLDRNERRFLEQTLARIPVLAEDLAVTLTKQHHTRPRFDGMGGKRRKGESALPLHLGAAAAKQELHNALVTAVRHVCEYRGLDYDCTDDLTSMSRWLHRRSITLALVEGSRDFAADICDAYDECRRIIDIPAEDRIIIDAGRLAAANRQVLTAAQIEKIAPQLGDLGAGLNVRRLRTLVSQGKLKPADADGDTKFYRLGDVLDAHHRHADTPGRQKRSSAN